MRKKITPEIIERLRLRLQSYVYYTGMTELHRQYFLEILDLFEQYQQERDRYKDLLETTAADERKKCIEEIGMMSCGCAGKLAGARYEKGKLVAARGKGKEE